MRPIRRVLALEVGSSGVSFAVLENTERLIEWGGRGLGKDVSEFITRLVKLVERYRPDVLVVEDPASSRKGERVRTYLAWAEQWAVDQELPVRPVPAESFAEYISYHSDSKYGLALSLIELFPALSKHLPPKRKAWQSESRQLATFVAVTRGLWYYEQ